jgi:hypothetical protein
MLNTRKRPCSGKERLADEEDLSIASAVKLDNLITRQLTSALEAELAKKGLIRTDSDNADLYLGYQVAIGKEKELTTFNTAWGAGPRWRGPGIGTVTTNTLLVGSLALDMYDVSKKQLVWRGVVTKTIDQGAKPEKRQQNLQKAVAKLLKNYPPSQKK